jgi:hypothetical protein
MLDDVSSHLHLSLVINPERPPVGIAGQVTDLLQRHALSEQIGDSPSLERSRMGMDRRAGRLAAYL